MLKTRLCAVGVGLLAAATFALAGCSDKTPAGGGTTPPTTSAPQADAKDAFIEAANKLNDQTVKIETKMQGVVGMTSTGQVDPAAKTASFVTDMSIAGTQMKMTMIAIDADVWMKMSGAPGMPDKWMHLAADKVKAGSTLDLLKNGDASGAEDLASTVVEVQRDGASGFQGTMDLTKSKSLGEDMLKELGDKGAAVPFTATVDAEGRLSSMTVDMEAAVPGSGKITSTYSGFGDPVEVTKPASSEVIEMPAEILAAMNR